MWFESVFQVGDEPVGLSVQRLDDDERDRTAATLRVRCAEATGCRA